MMQLINDLIINETDIIAGVDEAGRGPLAGPVVSCGCYFTNYDDF